MWDINTKPHSSKKLGVDPFLVQKWTKNCKKTADFQVAKKICLTVNFLFYSKNQLFQTSFIAPIFKNQAFCHSGLSQPKNFRVRTPLSSNNEKKILQNFPLEVSNSHSYQAARFAVYALPTVPSRPYKGESRYLIKWILKMFVSKLESWFGAIHKWYPMTGLFFLTYLQLILFSFL